MTDLQTQPAGMDRRIAPRYPYQASLQIEWGSAVLPAQLRDISAGGMFIQMSEPLWIGARFAAKWAFKTPLQIECEVRRVEPGNGMGVAYTIADPEGKERVLALLESLGRR
jgi:PilZ domain-containing protein